MTVLHQYCDRVLGMLAILGCLSYGAAALVTIADILGRRMGMPINGVVDIVQLLVLGGAWMAIPYAFVRGAHVGVDFIVETLPQQLRRVLAILVQILAFGLIAGMLFYGLEAFRMQVMMGDRSQQLGIPIAAYWIPLLIGQGACLVALASVALRLLQGRPLPRAEVH